MNDPRQQNALSGQNEDPSSTSTMPPRRVPTITQFSAPNRTAHQLSRTHMPNSVDGIGSQYSLPVLRWFSRGNSPEHSPSPSPAPSPTNALSEAMDEHFKLPSRPEAAMLTHSFRPYNRPPYMLGDLTKSALPTSSLSPPAQSTDISKELPTSNYTVDSAYPVLLTHLPPSVPARSSLDTLRSLHVQKPVTPPNASPQKRNISLSGPLLSWFQSEAPDGKQHQNILDEDDQASDSDQERERIRHKYLAPKNPIVFCHGLLGFDSVTIGPSIAPIEVTHWRGIKEVLELNGAEVLITRVPATSSPIDRAKVLFDKISEVYPGRKIHLIGHSMGGLDCRYMTTHLTDRSWSVLSITTIASPHRGSAFADYFLATVGQARMPQVLSLLDLLPNGGGDGKAFEFLTTENMKKFNEETPDVDGVKYFSYGAVYDPGLIDTWKFSHSVVLEKEGPNDGLVSVMSSRWGTYLGTLENVSHLDLVGWINTARYKWAEFMGRKIKFKPATFYLGIADHLAKAVEGLKPGDRGDQGKNQVVEGEEPEPAQSFHAAEAMQKPAGPISRKDS